MIFLSKFSQNLESPVHNFNSGCYRKLRKLCTLKEMSAFNYWYFLCISSNNQRTKSNIKLTCTTVSLTLKKKKVTNVAAANLKMETWVHFFHFRRETTIFKYLKLNSFVVEYLHKIDLRFISYWWIMYLNLFESPVSRLKLQSLRYVSRIWF